MRYTSPITPQSTVFFLTTSERVFNGLPLMGVSYKIASVVKPVLRGKPRKRHINANERRFRAHPNGALERKQYLVLGKKDVGKRKI